MLLGLYDKELFWLHIPLCDAIILVMDTKRERKRLYRKHKKVDTKLLQEIISRKGDKERLPCILLQKILQEIITRKCYLAYYYKKSEQLIEILRF